MKVLVCDDDRALVLLLSKYLRATYQADVRTVSRGDEALAELDGFDADLVILDHMMPGRDGASTLQAIRARSGRERPKVLLYSAFDLSRNAVAQGADGFLQKPASVDKIKAAIDRLMGGA